MFSIQQENALQPNRNCFVLASPHEPIHGCSLRLLHMPIAMLMEALMMECNSLFGGGIVALTLI